MSKFLDKKEQVYEFRLTNYGRNLLSIGKLKPAYYTFVDDNVIYDSAYFGASESQNDTHKRIKQDTPYLESLVLFENVSGDPFVENELDFNYLSLSAIEKIATKSNFRFDSIIGDAFVAESKEKVPSWKLVSLNSKIVSSATTDQVNQTNIPQINITASYSKEVVDAQEAANQNISANDERILEAISLPFADDKVVLLRPDSDPLLYIEEINTEVLNDNFEVEVFLIQNSPEVPEDRLTRKYFQNKQEQIVDGMMVSPNPINIRPEQYTSDSVENYFSIIKDGMIEPSVACKASEEFNKESYLVDIDFDCSEQISEDLFYDIYGSETEAEICQT